MLKRLFPLLIGVVLCAMQMSTVKAGSVTCERMQNYGTWNLGSLVTCYMDESTAINSRDVTIDTKDHYTTVKGLWFLENKAIKFLPIKISESFPNLVALDAQYCSLTEITYENFAGLDQLAGLYLTKNAIEKIDYDTFKDLVSLKELNLKSNKIKQMNGAALRGFIFLRKVLMRDNTCINEDFDSAVTIINMQERVDASCGYVTFRDLGKTSTQLVAPSNEERFKKLEDLIEKLENKVNEILTAIKNQDSEIAAVKASLNAK